MKFRTIKLARAWAKTQTLITGLVHRPIITRAYKQHNDNSIAEYWCYTVVLDALHFVNHR